MITLNYFARAAIPGQPGLAQTPHFDAKRGILLRPAPDSHELRLPHRGQSREALSRFG